MSMVVEFLFGEARTACPGQLGEDAMIRWLVRAVLAVELQGNCGLDASTSRFRVASGHTFGVQQHGSIDALVPVPDAPRDSVDALLALATQEPPELDEGQEDPRQDLLSKAQPLVDWAEEIVTRLDRLQGAPGAQASPFGGDAPFRHYTWANEN
jgi:hypothetical protein